MPKLSFANKMKGNKINFFSWWEIRSSFFLSRILYFNTYQGDCKYKISYGSGAQSEASLQKVPIYFLTLERSGNCGWNLSHWVNVRRILSRCGPCANYECFSWCLLFLYNFFSEFMLNKGMLNCILSYCYCVFESQNISFLITCCIYRSICLLTLC